MKMGEINALWPECINFSKGFIHVDRTISHGKASPFLKEGTKTKAGERDVPIVQYLSRFLKKLLSRWEIIPTTSFSMITTKEA